MVHTDLTLLLRCFSRIRVTLYDIV